MKPKKTWDQAATEKARRALLATRLTATEIANHGGPSYPTIVRIMQDPGYVMRENVALRILATIARMEGTREIEQTGTPRLVQAGASELTAAIRIWSDPAR